MKIEAPLKGNKTTRRSQPQEAKKESNVRSNYNPSFVVVLILICIYLAPIPNLVQAPKPPPPPPTVIENSNSQVANNSTLYTASQQQQAAQVIDANVGRTSAGGGGGGRQQAPDGGNSKQPTVANERINLIEADENGLYLVGLFDIHHSNPRVPFKCGPIDVDVGEWHSRRPMQNMEAFLWAIEQVNADKSLLPGVRLGSLVMDTCSSFLRTNQQLANLLHGGGGNGNPHLASGTGKISSNRQIAAIIADNSDWQSVEAVVSMATAQGLTTFVTQSRSSKLSELALKYKPTNQLDLNQNLRLSLSPQVHPIGLAAASAPESPSRGARFRRNSGGVGPIAPPLDSLLGELLGIGKMTLPRPLAQAGNSSSWLLWPEEQRLHPQVQPMDQQQQQQQPNKLYMVRMLLGNELLADAIGSLVQQMNWDLVSVIYDDDQDIVDLHDELVRQLFTRNIQLALDEQIALGAPTETYDRLLQSLAKKSTIGARVVITLLGTGSARLLLDSLHHLRGSISSSPEQVNSLLWISITDREPYYSFATDALGTIAISGSVSLLPEFRTYYDKLANEQHGAVNRWWPEYMRAILLKHQRDIELVSNECARWQEPRVSPLNEKCRLLTLSSLVQFEKSANQTGFNGNKSSSSLAAGDLHQQQHHQQQKQFQASKLAKYLANGWEHNGMDIINSVLAAANGLESIRQTLCPNQQVGLCDRMRELILGQNNANTNRDSSNSNGKQNQMPMLSELIYNELLRSTFQLADGRMFNLDDFNSPVGQVEGKFKFYNLRYLQQNSIGFVKFGSFDQMDGLELNTTKARHYPTANSYLDQEPLETVKSTCEDEGKCLMLGTHTGGSMISEEELASGVNSLFKLDHPILIPQSTVSNQQHGGSQQQVSVHGQPLRAAQNSQASVAASMPIAAFHEVAGTAYGGGSQHNQHKQQTNTIPHGKLDDSQVHTMHTAPGMRRFNWSSTMPDYQTSAGKAAKGTNSAGQLGTVFNTIVLLPLHKGYQSSDGSQVGECSPSSPMDWHSFQLLVALSYVQQSVNGALAVSVAGQQQHQLQLSGTKLDKPSRQSATGGNANDNNGNNNNNNNDVSSVAAAATTVKPQIELTTTVIDYCDQLELAKSKLQTRLLDSTRQQQISKRLPAEGKTVAVIDFDAQVSENIDNLLENTGQLLHLTIGSGLAKSGSPSLHHHHHPTNNNYLPPQALDGGSNGGQAKTASSKLGNKREHNHLKLSLMPSKSNEIQALVKLISSMPQWRLVHLIYTDHHHYRDEFVRRANEANICVSKLIWIPSIVGQADGGNGFARSGNNNRLDNGNTTGEFFGHSNGNGRGYGADASQQMVQLEKTRGLFARELHDYSSKTAKQQQQPQQQKENQLDLNGAQGLNSTRVLVVLASSNEATNRMILEAASESMLEDYVWITSHEWLASVELPAAELATSRLQASEQIHTQAPQKNKLPRLYLSTRLETYDSHGFRRYLSSLSPAIHAPIPTPWFDEFWQQHFRCRLPIPRSRSVGIEGGPDGSLSSPQLALSSLPYCKQHQHIDLQHMMLDDRVHYVIEALESIHEALGSTNGTAATSVGSAAFASQVRRSLERRRQLGSSGAAHLSSISHSPYGFHIVHRLLPLTVGLQVDHSSARVSDNTTSSRRRANNRDLSTAESRAQGQLLRVGLWRDGQLILLLKKPSLNNNNNEQLTMKNSSNFDNGQSHNHCWWLNSRAAGMDSSSGLDLDTANFISRSLAKLSGVKSRCSLNQTCALCQQQIEQTMAIIRQEEARLQQSESAAEPTAISSIWSHRQQQQQQTGPSKLDSAKPNYSFDVNLTGDGANGIGGDDGDDDDQDDQSDKYKDDNNKMILSNNDRGDIQASASSLFDGTTSKRVGERQRELELHRLYGQMTKLQQARRLDNLRPTIGLNLRQAPALLTSMLSLVGIVCMVASMTYFYPNMLDKSAIGRANDQPGVSSAADSRAGLAAHTLSNINDYFLLTGLLMLYSINVAFLLPATMGVCCFRRIGLATSYTVIFSSILVKVMNSCRQSSRQQRGQQSQQQLQHKLAQSPTKQRQLDPLEDSIEVTFESLTHDHGLTSVDEEQQSQQQQTATNCSTIDHLTNGYQTTALEPRQPPALAQAQTRPDGRNWGQNWYSTQGQATMLIISLFLILCQVIVSLVWFIQQPPEPTLYLACWRCASPTRSPTLFLYEPLLSLLYPAVILVLAWCLSIVAFRMASQNEEQYRLATRRLLAGGAAGPQIITATAATNGNQLKYEQRQLDHKLRDAKSLIMATTMIVFVWSIVTLNMISSSHNTKLMPQQQLLMPPSNGPQASNREQSVYFIKQNESAKNVVDDLNLVYANILSGAIIFSFLFLYRLHLFKCPWTHSLGHARKHHSLRVATNGRGNKPGKVHKFNHRAQDQLPGIGGGNNRWFGNEDIFPVPTGGSFFNGSQFSTENRDAGGHERLKLQQFNSSYGTYSAGLPTSPFSGTKRNKKKPPVAKPRSSNGVANGGGQSNGPLEFRLQRRQSSGSVASSTAKLVGDNGSMDNDMFMDDTISCASSVASSSTSQLQGNELYPIDCSMQLDSQVPTQNSLVGDLVDCTLNRSNSFNRHSSLRRSMTQAANKLSSVREEQVANECNGASGIEKHRKEVV